MREVIERVKDDLDGSEGAETVHFGLDGVGWEIDLSPENATEFRDEVLKIYMEKGRRSTVSVARRDRKSRRNGTSTDDAQVARLWALSQNIEGVSARGRLSAAVLAQWEAAGRPEAPAAPTAPAAPATQPFSG